MRRARDLLSPADDRDRHCVAIDALVRQNLAEVDRKIGDLGALRYELDSRISQCRHGAACECRIKALGRNDTRAA